MTGDSQSSDDSVNVAAMEALRDQLSKAIAKAAALETEAVDRQTQHDAEKDELVAQAEAAHEEANEIQTRLETY